MYRADEMEARYEDIKARHHAAHHAYLMLKRSRKRSADHLKAVETARVKARDLGYEADDAYRDYMDARDAA